MGGARIRKNDTVVVISGKDRGKRGRVIEVLPKASKVRVEGVNKIKRHTKPNPQRNVKGGIVEREHPIHVSNVAMIDPKSEKPTRLRVKVLKDGTKVRIAVRSGLQLDK
ncbi:MAG TPA: 50S ribosomal protein L24 [Candidatus Polarisedimenticolaceae bacterium]|nr:50S ribosomal protein L24 [Candidatus Polarisedimenticolaceae bacterium]